jgi:hypothetical protein
VRGIGLFETPKLAHRLKDKDLFLLFVATGFELIRDTIVDEVHNHAV